VCEAVPRRGDGVRLRAAAKGGGGGGDGSANAVAMESGACVHGEFCEFWTRSARARARTRALGACARVVGSEMRNAALRRRSGGDGGGGNRHRTCDEKGAMGREGRVHNGARLMAERMCWRRHRLESSGALVSGGRLHNACSVAGQCPIAFSRRRSSRLRGVLSTAAGLRRVEWAAAGRPESARVRESDAGHLRPSAGQRSQSDVPV